MTEQSNFSYIVPKVSSVGFTALQPLMTGQEDFPSTFKEWKALWEDRRQDIESDGYRVAFVNVAPTAFAKFCKVHRKRPNWDSLEHYLTVKADQ